MEKKLSPEQGFQIISEVISQARVRFERNGFLMIFWGLVIAVLSLSQYFLIKSGVEKYYYVNYFYVLAALVTVVYMALRSKKQKSELNFLSKLTGWIWLIINVNIFVAAFGFHKVLGFNLVFITLLLVSLGYYVTAMILQSPVLIAGAVLMNLLVYVTLFVNSIENLMLVMAGIAVLCIFIPGLIIQLKSKSDVV